MYVKNWWSEISDCHNTWVWPKFNTFTKQQQVEGTQHSTYLHHATLKSAQCNY